MEPVPGGNITEMYYYYDIATRMGMELRNTSASGLKAEEVKTILIRAGLHAGCEPGQHDIRVGIRTSTILTRAANRKKCSRCFLPVSSAGCALQVDIANLPVQRTLR